MRSIAITHKKAKTPPRHPPRFSHHGVPPDGTRCEAEAAKNKDDLIAHHTYNRYKRESIQNERRTVSR